MPTFVIALFVAIGGAGWAYAKIQRITGGNTQTSLTMAGLAGVILFLLAFMLFSFLPE